MVFLSTITTTEQDSIRAGGYGGRLYLLHHPNTIVFQAQIEIGASPSAPSASIYYKNVTAGTYTDILDGYTVYLSSTPSIRDAYYATRVRGSATTSTINVQQTDVQFSVDDYIIITNDVRLTAIPPRVDYTGAVYRDYDISFRRLLPVINNLDSAYVLVLNGGTASLALSPTATAMDSGATITSWSWDVGGLAIASGSATSQNITIEATTAGYYHVRLTVIDSNGNSQWRAINIFVVDENFSGLD
ncbi:MAG: PKD domain-containing protein, partial [Chloroflexi bacterium]